MASLRFEWDEAKNLANQRKHGISFEEAMRVFDDPLHVSKVERIVDNELRWQTLGYAGASLFVTVVNTFEELQEGLEPVVIIRIISARRATRRERREYEGENR